MREGCKSCVDWKKKVDDRIRFLRSMLFGVPALGIWAALLFFPELNWVTLIGLVGTLVSAITAGMCISYVIIGTYYYFFYDKDGECHCHTEAPLILYGHAGHSWSNAKYATLTGQEHPTEEDFLIAGMVLRVKLGSWLKSHLTFRKSAGSRLHNRESGWVITDRAGDQITFKVAETGLDSMTTRPDVALSFMNNCDWGQTTNFVVNDAARAFAALSDTKKKLAKMQGLLDWLGIGVTTLHRELLETRAWSRSPVGKLARERLEALLGPCTQGQSDCWMQGKPTEEGQVAYAAIVAERAKHLASMAEHPAPTPQPVPPTPAKT